MNSDPYAVGIFYHTPSWDWVNVTCNVLFGAISPGVEMPARILTSSAVDDWMDLSDSDGPESPTVPFYKGCSTPTGSRSSTKDLFRGKNVPNSNTGSAFGDKLNTAAGNRGKNVPRSNTGNEHCSTGGRTFLGVTATL